MSKTDDEIIGNYIVGFKVWLAVMAVFGAVLALGHYLGW